MGRARGTQHATATAGRRYVPGLGATVASNVMEGLAVQYHLSGQDPATFTDDIEKQPTPNMDNGVILLPRRQGDVDAILRRWNDLGPQPVAHDLECAASPTVPNGSGLHPHLGTIRLAQFGVADGGNGTPEALVIDTWQHDPAQALELLSNPDWETIIHYAQMEQRWLGWRYGVRVNNLLDTRHAAKLNWERQHAAHVWTPKILEDKLRISEDKIPQFALGITAKRELGLELDKTQQNSYWDAPKLTAEQLKYAGEDVLSLLDLKPRVTDMLTPEDRETMRIAGERLGNKWSGVVDNWEEARDLDPDFNGPRPVHGSEKERAVRIIQACRTVPELKKARNSMVYMRISRDDRDLIEDELRRQRRRIRENRTERTTRVKVAGWNKPF